MSEVEKQKEKTCPDCNGSGTKTTTELNPVGIALFGFPTIENTTRTCRLCGGSGKVKV